MPNSSKVRVVVRTRPTQDFAYGMVEFMPDGKSINIHATKDVKQGVVNNQITDWSFRLDGILHNSSQDTMFEYVAKDMVDQTLNGYNATLMVYGQTGAGKTYTMSGATESFQHRGIIPRALAQLYRGIEEQYEYSRRVRVSYLELYNETMFDLLSTLPDTGEGVAQMSIAEDENGIQIKGLSQHIANSEEEALNLLFEGETNRVIAEHSMNKHSSRSHCIFTVHIESRSRTESSAKYTVSKINFVDLAGSERIGKTNSEGSTQTEARYINKSLTFLEQTVIAMADRRRDHIPYRQSKLTHCLKDSIGGNSNMVMVANIWGESQHIEETISTLRFATRMMCVPIEPAVNILYDPTLMVKQLEKDVRALKQELAMHDTLANRNNVNYDTLSEAQGREVEQQVRRFLEGSLDEIDIVNVRQIQAVFGVFRNIYNQTKVEIEEKYSTGVSATDDAPSNRKAQSGDEDSLQYVGETDGMSFSAGVAPPGAKPAASSVITGKKSKKKSKQGSGRKDETSSPTPGGLVSENGSNRNIGQGAEQGPPSSAASTTVEQARPPTPPPRMVSFDEFKRDVGSEINRILTENKEVLNQKKKEMRDLAKAVNLTKTEIDETRRGLNVKRNDRYMQGEFVTENGDTVIDEEEYLQIKQLKDLKQRYRFDYEELKHTKAEVKYCQRLVDQCRQRLISEFDTWYSETFLANQDDYQGGTGVGGGVMAGALSVPYGGRWGSEDEAERFDRTQIELRMQKPESVAYVNAKLNTARRQHHDNTGRYNDRQNPGATPVMQPRAKQSNPLAVY